jgi:DNA replication protein DnaC
MDAADIKDTVVELGEQSGHRLELLDEKPDDVTCEMCDRPQPAIRWPYTDKWVEPPKVCERCESERSWQQMKTERFESEWQASGINDSLAASDLRTLDLELPKVLAKLTEIPREHDLPFWAVYIWGPVGTGKTTMCARAIRHYLDHWILGRGRTNTTARFVNIKDAIRQEKESFSDDAKKVDWDAIRHADLLVLDDLGRERATNFSAEIVDDIIEQRYRNKWPTIFVSNRELGKLSPSPEADEDTGHPNYDERLTSRMHQMCGGQIGKFFSLHMRTQHRTMPGGN